MAPSSQDSHSGGDYTVDEGTGSTVFLDNNTKQADITFRMQVIGNWFFSIGEPQIRRSIDIG